MKKFLSFLLSFFMIFTFSLIFISCKTNDGKNQGNVEKICEHDLVLVSIGTNCHRYECKLCDYVTESEPCSFCGEYLYLSNMKHQKLCSCGNVIAEEKHDLVLLHDDNGMHWFKCKCGVETAKVPCNCGEPGETPGVRPD